MKYKNSLLNNEFILIFYLFSFTILKPFTTSIPDYSTAILLTLLLSVMVISLIINDFLISRTVVYITVFSTLIFAIEIIFRFNPQSSNYIKDFYIYGLSTIYFFSKVVDYNKMLSYFVILGTVSYIVIFIDPFLGYVMSDTYMVFGYTVLPSFAAMYIGYKFFRIKTLGMLTAVAFLQLLVYANRGSILTAISIVVIYYIYDLLRKQITQRVFIMEMLKAAVLSVIIITILMNISSIVETMYFYLLERDFNSYSLATLSRFLDNKSISNEMSTRTVIHETAWEVIRANSIFGKGPGWFHNFYGIYSHNIVLDFLLTFGIIGTSLVMIIFVLSIMNVRKYVSEMHIFYLSMMLITVIPLWFSMHFMVSKTFWIIIYIGLVPPPKQRKGGDFESEISTQKVYI